MGALEEFCRSVSERSTVVGIIGLGYVGLPLVVRFADEGFQVIGFDNDEDKVNTLNKGHSPIEHLSNSVIAAAIETGFEATTDIGRVREADALLICLPTPLGPNRQPDLGYVVAMADAMAQYLRPGQLVSLESTTYPGTTEDELGPRLARTNLKIGVDLFVAYSPEREDPANPEFSTRTIPKVCGGMTPSCLKAAVTLYGAVIDSVVPVSSTAAAEMTKLLENIHRAVNIGLVNEMKVATDRMGIDVYEVIDAAATKPFGFVPYYPGPGLGGHCIPIDPFYFTWKAREYGIDTRFIELAGEVNRAMPAWVLGKLADALNDCGKALNGSRVLVLGVAYKKNVDDMRESPALEIMSLLQDKGATLSYADPHVPYLPHLRKHDFDLVSMDLEPVALAHQDAVILVTDHDAFDYDRIRDHAQLIIDARGRYRHLNEPHIIRA